MDQNAMLAQFRISMQDRASKIDGATILRYMNHQWQRVLPSLVDGGWRQGEVQFTLTAGKDTYDLDTAADVGSSVAGIVYQIEPGISFVDSVRSLKYYESTEEFFAQYRRNDLVQGQPTGVLVRERTITLRPIPSADFVQVKLAVPARLYRSAITSTGIANDEWAFGVIRGAARDYAVDHGYVGIAKSLDALYEGHVTRLQGQSLSRPNFNASKHASVRRMRDY